MARNKQFKEHEVLERALQLFWKLGFHATSIQLLVDHLQINRASLYDTFGGKNELFETVLNMYHEQKLNTIAEFLESKHDRRTGLLDYFEMEINESIQDPDRKGCFSVNTTTELIPGDDGILFTLTDFKNEFERIFESNIQEGQSMGTINSDFDADELATFIFALYSGLKVSAKLNPFKGTLMSSVELALKILD